MADSGSGLVAELRAEAELLRQWTVEKALPLWGGAAMHPSGASWEALDFNGRPALDDETRVRVQARQLFVFCLACRQGWESERSLGLAERLFDVVAHGCRRSDGLFGRTYSLERGYLVDDTYDLYDTAFAILGLASARDVLGRRRVDDVLRDVVGALERTGTHPDGGYRETAANSPERRQNPHMHLFESLLAADVAGYGEEARRRRQRLFAFIDACFFDANLGIVHETSPRGDVGAARFEPGHSFEWVWLLTWAAQCGGVKRHPIAPALYRRAAASLDGDGRACMEATVRGDKTDSTCRLWSQAEALKAHLCMATCADGRERSAFVAAAVRCCYAIRRLWLEPAVAGGWIDHVDETGRVLAADMPAGTGYHLFGAIAALEHATVQLEEPVRA